MWSLLLMCLAEDGFYRKFLRGGRLSPPVALDILKKYFDLRQANPNYFQVGTLRWSAIKVSNYG